MSTTTAKTRKRCPGCNRMVEVGEDCVAIDGTYIKSAQYWIGQGAYKRGAWHLWHPECHTESLRLIAEAKVRSDAEYEARFAEMRAAVACS